MTGKQICVNNFQNSAKIIRKHCYLCELIRLMATEAKKEKIL